MLGRDSIPVLRFSGKETPRAHLATLYHTGFQLSILAHRLCTHTTPKSSENKTKQTKVPQKSQTCYVSPLILRTRYKRGETGRKE